MRTEAQIARVDLEFQAVDRALNLVHWVDHKHTLFTWKSYCEYLGATLVKELTYGERLEAQR